MGAVDIQDNELESLGISIEGVTGKRPRKLRVPKDKLVQYIRLIKAKLSKGFWNEIVLDDEIIFIFKFKDGAIKEYKLSPENEKEIDMLCAEFNNEPVHENPNVYKYISENDFYRDFMKKHYAETINR